MKQRDICGIMQPYFLPYLGHFQLIEKCGTWIIFDNIQFSSKTWVNRNRITDTQGHREYNWITVPINKSQNALIKDINIATQNNWKNKIYGRIKSLKRQSPHFDEAETILTQIIEFQDKNLSNFVVNSLQILIKALELDVKIFRQSVTFPQVTPSMKLKPGEWALELTKEIGASIYLNPIGGAHLFQPSDFHDIGINLGLLKYETPKPYAQKSYINFSIIELIARLGLNEVRQLTKLGQIVTQYD